MNTISRNRIGVFLSSSALILALLHVAVVFGQDVGVSQTVSFAGQHGQAVLVNVGANSRTWQIRDNASSAMRSKPVVEFATGMHYWDGTNWRLSDPSFAAVDNGFVADRVQAKARLASNLNSRGAVEITTAAGETLRSTPVAIGLYDTVSGASTIIATVKDSFGVLTGSNQVVYVNAFAGAEGAPGVCADLVYSLNNYSFAQDVVLTGRLDVEAYGFPTNSTQIQIITEFYDYPEPDVVRVPIRVEQDMTRRRRMATPDFVDNHLGFGDFVLGQGHAYTMNGSNVLSDGIVVAKEFTKIGDRQFLVESINYSAIQDEISALPDCGEQGDHASIRTGKAKEMYASIRQPDVLSISNSRKSNVTQVASNPVKTSGFVIDYIATFGAGSLSGTQVFSGETNYCLTGPVVCNGAVTIEGGAIFKYATDASLTLNNSLTCATTAMSPAVFTSIDDDSIGESMSGISGCYGVNQTPAAGYANPALVINYITAPPLKNLIFRYCKQAINLNATVDTASALLTVADSQLVGCVQGISITGIAGGGCGCGCGSYCGMTLTVNNTLFDTVGYPVSFPANLNTYEFGNFVHCTFSGAQRVATFGSCGGSAMPFGMTINVTNSIFYNVTSLYNGSKYTPTFGGNFNGFYNSSGSSPTFGNSWFKSAACPFPVGSDGNLVGRGKYYLDAPEFIANGTTAWVPSDVLLALRSRTTMKPSMQESVAGNVTFAPQVVRYTSGNPNLGYYYPAVDYLIGGVTVPSGTSVTVAPGTTLAFTDSGPGAKSIGFTLGDNATFQAQGIPNAVVNFTKAAWIQEGASVLTKGGVRNPYVVALASACTGSGVPVVNLRFVRSALAADDYHLAGGVTLTSQGVWDSGLTGASSAISLVVRDSAFRGGRIGMGQPASGYSASVGGSITLQNNQFERVYVYLNPSVPLPVYAYNNLFRFGMLRLQPYIAGNWVFAENLFDQPVFAVASSPGMAWGTNAYRTASSSYVAMAGNSGWLYQGPAAVATPAFSELNRVTLSQDPSYSVGPMGSYYILQSSATYIALKAQGRTVATSGLYHYTERADRMKEGVDKGANGKVDIGLHYVSTDTYGLPIDSDYDGTPDYISDTNGNGTFDTGETDWLSGLVSVTDMTFYTPLRP